MILKGLLENGAKLSYFRLDGFLARTGRYANRNLTPFHPDAPKRIKSPRSMKKRDESTVTENLGKYFPYMPTSIYIYKKMLESVRNL